LVAHKRVLHLVHQIDQVLRALFSFEASDFLAVLGYAEADRANDMRRRKQDLDASRYKIALSLEVADNHVVFNDLEIRLDG
jgi:carotenoid cleavage dioxygenase-like enzyme